MGANLTAKLLFQPRPEGGEERGHGEVHREGSQQRYNYQGPEGESTEMDVITPNLPSYFHPIHSMPQPSGSGGDTGRQRGEPRQLRTHGASLCPAEDRSGVKAHMCPEKPEFGEPCPTPDGFLKLGILYSYSWSFLALGPCLVVC